MLGFDIRPYVFNERLSPSTWYAVLFIPFLGLTLGAPLSLQAQIAADRPGFADGTATVDAGTVQLSGGYAFNGDGASLSGASYDTHELGQLLLRYGVIDGVEIRGGGNSLVVTESPLDNGYNGTSLGTKVHLFENGRMSVSGLATVALPTGTGFFESEDRFQQEIKVAADAGLSEKLALTVNGGARFFYASEDQLHWLFLPALSYDLAERIGAYVGYAGFYHESVTVNWLEGGLTLLLDQDTQLDANAGVQVDNGTQPYFLGVGVAHRF